MIQYHKDADNIVTLTLDKKNSSVNIINRHLSEVWLPVLAQLRADAAEKQLAGVIITSAKRSFLAGGDLDYLHSSDDSEHVFEYSQALNNIFRQIEQLPVPVVAAINVAALGSGYELALACHYRIALDLPNTIIGLPEVNLGMIPGGGSIVRLTWLLGIEAAFELLSKGKSYHVKEAYQRGLIDAVAEDTRSLMAQAYKFIRSSPNLTKTWDKGLEPPKLCNPRHPDTAQLIANLNAQLFHRTRGNLPAQQAVLNAIYECMQVDFDQALNIVSRHFAEICLSPTCRNMTKAFWYDFNRIRNGANRPKGFGRFRARRIGIIGAGDMGAGIAYISALEGIDVVLKDISISIAQQGKNIVHQQLDALCQQGKLSKAQAKDILDRIKPSDKLSDFEDCDLVIEAVFENAELKKRIARETELYLPRQAFFASNSATLSIDMLSESFSRPQTFVGMHFFAPILQSQLVEVVVGKNTNEETIARAFDFVQHVGKVPIIVKDAAGFYTLRVLRTYVLEALLLLEEGQTAAYIRNASLLAGMKRGPFAIADEQSLRLFLDLELARAAQMGNDYDYPKALEVLKMIVVEHRRMGKQAKAGFYDYKGGEMDFWAELPQLFPIADRVLPAQDVMDRLIFTQVLQAVRCLDEGVVQSAAEANLGSIYGWGFPAFKGGVLQFINDYGFDAFVTRCQYLAQQYGARFAPSEMLLTMQRQQLNFI
jgi:3-hydroxyacyl-CoA dehydrogenase / enoyl-CoA hydratase / 3-hydroxybutyryl-CoA epimerase